MQEIDNPEAFITACEHSWRPELLLKDSALADARGIMPNSPAGTFLRRCRLAFDSMPFEATVHMLTNIRGYLEVYEREAAARDAAPDDATAALVSQHFRAATSDPYPEAQLATYLSHHVDLVQQLSGVVPQRVITQSVAPVARKTGELPVAVSARLLSANISRTFNVALRSLMELHDSLIPTTTRAIARVAAAGGGTGGGPTKPPQQALLNLSQLHAEYGHMGHAMGALMEAVDVDQGSGDGESLVTCLSQLCAILRVVPPSESNHVDSPAATTQVCYRLHSVSILANGLSFTPCLVKNQT